MVEAVRRPGARRLHRRGARAQPEPAGRGRQRRAGRRRAHDDALAALPAAQLPGRRHAPALQRARPLAAARRRRGRQPGDDLPGARRRELGARPVGADPAAHRRGAREPARHRRGAARRRAVGHRLDRIDLPPAPRPRRAARGREADARGLRRVGQAVRAPVQVRPGVADERRAGALAVRDGGGADPGHPDPDRADRDRARDPARPQSRADRARQAARRARAAERARRACPRSSSSVARTSCRPSRPWSPPTRRSARRRRSTSRRSR